jgi:hypothetical protein
MQYAVHLYPTVRVKVTGIEADSVAEAFAKAQAAVDMHAVLDNPSPSVGNVEHIEWDEGANNFVLIDPLDYGGEVIYDASEWLDGDGNPLVDEKTLIEQKAAAADEATLFMQELLDSVETLAGIASVHGTRTVVDLMYLQGAILHGGFIDHYPGESAVMDIASGLPSGERWATFIKKDCKVQREPQQIARPRG